MRMTEFQWLRLCLPLQNEEEMKFAQLVTVMVVLQELATNAMALAGSSRDIVHDQ